jgi:hypothetical protein
MYDAAPRRAPIAERANPHVHRCSFAVALAFASGQELFQNMGQQLVRRHVGATSHELTSRDLVKDGGCFVIAGGSVDHVPLQLVDSVLQSTAVSAN